MDIRTQSILLAALVGTALGISMLLREMRPRVFTLYSLFSLSVGTHLFARFCFNIIEVPSEAPVLHRILTGVLLLSGAVVPSTAIAL